VGGYVELKIDLTASESEQTIVLPKVLRISGKVVDTAGQPIKSVTVIPVLQFRPDGTYAIELDRTDVSYRVRIEAPGYRTAMSDVAKAGMVDPTFDFRLEKAPSAEGRVVDAAGQPVKNAKVYLATHSQNLNNWTDETGTW
jgi:protocatechuate 3,4-dioxygenase beta subunit